jgi:acetyl esterase/lipase
MAIRLPAGLLRILLRLTVKPFLGFPFPVSFQRLWVRIMSNTNAPSRAASMERADVSGMSTLRAWPRGSEPKRTVLYLHGGGYCIGSWGTYKGLITHLAVAADTTVYAPNYRLAPEHPHPAALDDGVEAYRWLLERGISSDRISLAGDSAGGGLALATAIAIRDAELPEPASIALLSPWVDLRGDTPSMTTNARIDPVAKPSWSRSCALMYLNGRDPEDPACSPLFATHEGLPPILIQVGSDEIILDDSIRLADRCREAGVDVTIQKFDGYWHEVQIHAGILEAADQALAKIATFLTTHWEKRGQSPFSKG